MTIRILCIVVALITAVWISYKIGLSGGWTAFFTLLVSAAVGFLATITPLNYDELYDVKYGDISCFNTIEIRDNPVVQREFKRRN